MTRKLRLLELGLLVVLSLLGWQMRREWVWAHAREQALLQSRLRPTAVALPTALPKVEPLTAVNFALVAVKNLFSKDRNPDVILPPPAPVQEKPQPPFPVVRGVMLWPGAPPTVVLSKNSGGDQKGYHPGDKFGDWTIVSVDNKYLGLEWDGKQFKKRLDELFDQSSVVAEAQTQQAPTNAPVSGTTNLSAAGNAKSGPGQDVGNSSRTCLVGDTSPAGTIVDGMKKVVVVTPFGPSCRWDPAK